MANFTRNASEQNILQVKTGIFFKRDMKKKYKHNKKDKGSQNWFKGLNPDKQFCISETISSYKMDTSFLMFPNVRGLNAFSYLCYNLP